MPGTAPLDNIMDYRDLLDNLSLGVCRVVLHPRMRITFANYRFCQLTGYSADELLKIPITKLFADPRRVKSLVQQVLEQRGISGLEVSLKTKKKQTITCSCDVRIVQNTQGQAVNFDVVVQDISGQLRTEQELRESKELFRTVFNNSAVAIIVTDKEDRIMAWNPSAERMFGMEKVDLFNKPAKEIFPPEEWARLQVRLAQSKGQLSDVETQIYRKDGTCLDINTSVSVMRDQSGEIEGAIGIMSDITERKRVRQELMKAKVAAEEANVAKSLFLANMSHEVRTPMNTIMGMIDLTLDTEMNEEQKENLTIVKNAADILLTLLNDILDLSRVEAGKIQIEHIELNVRDILKSVCKSMAVLAKNKGLKLVWEVEDDVPDLVMGDPTRIRQVVVNLINNAIKFTFKGSINVHVRLSGKKEQDRCELTFSVRDEGVGIPKDKQDAIFEVFTQVDASTTRKFGGTGLGLTISRKLVEMMGGRIWVESVEFKGSTFYFVLPFTVVKKEDVPQALKAESIEDQLLAQLKPKREVKRLAILLAEDNIVNQKMTARMLEKRGWVVTVSDNGQQVLDYLKKGTFDLILMDAQMPVMDGFVATRQIREGEKKTGLHIPIIALTAKAMAGDKEKCLEAGMDDYVAKPIDRQQLYQTIEKFFN